VAGEFKSNGLGEPLCTDWMPMDAPVGPLLLEAGPEGSMEFRDNNGAQEWRMWKPFDWSLGG